MGNKGASRAGSVSVPCFLDLGCGPNKADGCIGIDSYPFPGVDIVRDLRRGLPFVDSTVDGIRAHHILEHFAAEDLLFLIDEMWRVCRPLGQWVVLVPDISSANRYRDPMHLTREWGADAFMLWEVDSNGDWPIFVGPSYQRRAKLKLLSTSLSNQDEPDRMYQLEVIKVG